MRVNRHKINTIVIIKFNLLKSAIYRVSKEEQLPFSDGLFFFFGRYRPSHTLRSDKKLSLPGL